MPSADVEKADDGVRPDGKEMYIRHLREQLVNVERNLAKAWADQRNAAKITEEVQARVFVEENLAKLLNDEIARVRAL
jgi:uncharacterized protein YqfA (UPF0365 family)